MCIILINHGSAVELAQFINAAMAPHTGGTAPAGKGAALPPGSG